MSGEEIVGWGPTVLEMDYLASKFGEVVHIACLHKGVDPPPSSRAYSNPNVKFIPLPPYGGSGMKNKLKILWIAPKLIRIIKTEIEESDAFQFRAPTSIGIYLIPFLNTFISKKGWFKYAGNWAQKNAPLSYQFQRFLLKNFNKRKVTINGSWSSQSSNFLSFENPCLETIDRQKGREMLLVKDYVPPYVACFVGRLEDAKGVTRIIEAGKKLYEKGFRTIHLLGNGPFRKQYEKLAANQPIDFIFHGFQSREYVFEIMKKSDFFLLPSTASEGFPKVIAEAANFGCIPIVSNISSVGQYISNENGFLWDTEKESFLTFVKNISFSASSLKVRAENAYKFSDSFTFNHYCDRIETEILS